ncbi:dATP/dGTP diphosphohydrolase domain-containing protein [Bordetella bronchiseptica]|uniref:dATP/dGTP diphosphohydrolase domain-containing protein n=1 Tax=Bordetella bronchiseptica TaxID=518 RepID=UPI00067E4C1A|nr:dATP/dGTP diphosphohydrolase domain-containing protein [Bordetella bronchiseptica]
MKKKAAPALGAKYDAGKPRWSLLRFGMMRALAGIVDVLTFGAQKYDDHSWRHVPNGIERYWSAMERHMNEVALHGPHARDGESGLLHIDHINTNGLFLAELLRDIKETA